MIKPLIVIYFLQTLTFIFVNCQYQLNSPCTTPDGLPGRCVIIDDCPPLFNFLRSEHLTQDTIQLLTKASCGFEGKEMRVCCRTHLPADCGKNIVTENIFGGTEANLGEYPWLALIEYKNWRGVSTNCGGVLISSRYVLTAAHCVVGPDVMRLGEVYAVRLGEHNKRTNPDCVSDSEITKICADPYISVRINEVIAHENYIPNSNKRKYDIALLRLSSDVRFTNFIKPICLPKDNNLKTKLVVAGWGKTEKGSSSDEKLHVKVPLVDQRQCLRVYANLLLDGYGQMCAGGKKGEDSCNGDSGGPLMSPNNEGRWSVDGIVSFGPSPCGKENKPGVYTRVFTFVPWIISKMRN